MLLAGSLRRFVAFVLAAVLASTLAGAPPAQAAPPAPAAPDAGTAAFRHPGVLVSRSQLEFVRLMVRLKQQPWKGAFDQLLAHRLADPAYQARPREIVACGSFSNPNLGCTEERQDALAAYANALAWVVTREKRYAEKAIEIMDAWSAVIKDHQFSNAPLQTGWAGSTWPRAAEIIRYTYRGWQPESVERFATMLRTVYLPVVLKGHAYNNGNWELTMMEAAVGIAVFLDDRASYDAALAKFAARVPAYIYLSSDVPLPPAPAGGNIDTPEKLIRFWGNQATFVDGLAQETCRDFVHTGYGLANIAHVAETTRIQGHSLYPELRTRLAAALEFHARYDLGEPVPPWLCGGRLVLGLGPATEVAFNGLRNRLLTPLPHTRKLTESLRPADTNLLFIGWDSLTHANNLF